MSVKIQLCIETAEYDVLPLPMRLGRTDYALIREAIIRTEPGEWIAFTGERNRVLGVYSNLVGNSPSKVLGDLPVEASTFTVTDDEGKPAVVVAIHRS